MSDTQDLINSLKTQRTWQAYCALYHRLRECGCSIKDAIVCCEHAIDPEIYMRGDDH